MGVQRVKTRSGWRYRFQKQVHGQLLLSKAIYLNKATAAAAEAEAVAQFLRTGVVATAPPPSSTSSVSETYAEWIRWLKLHRSERHAYNMESLLRRACMVAPELADLPAFALTEAQVEKWAERWAAQLVEAGKGRKTINDWLRYSQTAFSPPYGRRRARREGQNNPFKYIDRYATDRRVKYVPTLTEVDALRLASGGEFRLWLELTLETAARPTETLSLAWEDCGPDSIVLYTRKTADGSRQGRRLAIGHELAARLRSWRRQSGDTVYVFQQADQEAPHHLVWVRKQMRRACQVGGVRVFPPSSLRHYRASLWAREGKSLTWIRDALGHTKATTTDNYLRELRAV